MVVDAVVGSVLVPRIVAYRPRSLAVVSSSRFHDIQLLQLSLGLISRNLWMSCFGGGVEVEVGCVILSK